MSLVASTVRADDPAPPVVAPATVAPSDHAPRIYELRLASSWAPRAELPLSNSGASVRPFGVGLGLRIGWRVGGLAGSSPAWVGFDTQATLQPTTQGRESLILTYGIFVKHAFLPSARVHPVLAYGLGAAQLWVFGVEGRGIGHSTRLGIGVDIDAGHGSTLGVVLVYAATRMATFESASSDATADKIDQLELDLAWTFESGTLSSE